MSDLLTPERDRSGDDPSRPVSGVSAASTGTDGGGTEPRDDSGATLRGAAHWPALDGLRGLAVAGVVAFHLGWISGGFLGVDLFFALSGFLITTLLVREQRDTGRIDLAAFWGRRFRRLLPAVMALVVVVLTWTWIWGSPAEQAGARTDARWSIPYLANWHFIAEARDYWAAATESSVFTHLWSLAIEEQFYLVWPLVAWWALRSRAGERRLLQLTVIGSVASIAAMVLLYDPASPSRVYLGTDTRAAGLLLGAAMALDPIRRGLRSMAAAHPRRLDVVAGVIVVLLAVSWVIGGDHLGLLLQGGLPLHSLLSAVLVAVLVASSGLGDRSGAGTGFATAAFDRRWLVWLGQRSYGIYLWHWPVIVLAEPRWTGLPAPVRDLAMIAVSLVLAEVSFRLLEHPVRRRAGWASGARASWATLAVSALAIAIAVVAPSGRGHVATFDVGSVGAPAPIDAPAEAPPASAPAGSLPTGAPTEASVVPDTPIATTTSTPTVATTETAATTDATTDAAAPAGDGASAGAVAAGDAPVVLPEIGPVLWVGDSVANDLAPALGAAFGAAGVPWTNGAGDGVRFTPGGGVDPVELWTRVLDGATFSTVVLHLSYWDSPADLDMLRVSFSWFRDTVVARGARLVIVTPPPVRDDLVDPGLARQIQVAQELVDGSAGAVVLVDSAPLWGPTMAYDIDGDGAPDRKPDGVHVCPQGAARFANWFVAELATRFAGITPQPAAAWAAGPWATDARYDTPAGACVALG